MTSATTQASGFARFRDAYGRLLEWVVLGLMVILAVEVILGIVFRVIGSPLVWYDEMASVLLAWLTFYGSALASVKRGHIGCPELIDQLPAATRRRVNIFSQVLVIGFFALLGWVGASILPILADEMLVSVPWLSVAVIQSVIPISSALILIAEVIALIDLIRQTPQAHHSALADGLH
jgi:TRAP-type C4-dicarboxylate transport system permease small subunit